MNIVPLTEEEDRELRSSMFDELYDKTDRDDGYEIPDYSLVPETEREALAQWEKDLLVTNPMHYRQHPSGVECITITEHMGFNLGNAVKYIWRADLKEDALKDLRKAAWYIAREIAKRSTS